jgi:hypothetical protein
MNFMKRIQTITAYLVVLVLAGVSSLKSAEPGHVPGKATVRSVSGACTYTDTSGMAHKLRVNMELDAGATISTGPDSFVYLNINGLTSSVRVGSETSMSIPTMERIGAARDSDTVTMLDLRTGGIEGNVKKVAANSQYEIKTPHGVAGIRGTDFNITVTLLPSGEYQVTFTSVTGQIIVSAIVNGASVVRTLNDHESWTPGYGDVVPTPVKLLDTYLREIDDMINYLQQTGLPTVTVPEKYPTGNPPGGGSSSPHK